jgi:STAS domain
MEIQHSMRDGCLVLSFTGGIDLFSVSAVQRTVLKDLSQEPYALICDLSGVTHLDPVCASVFATVANHPPALADHQLPAVQRPTGRGRDPRPTPGAAVPAAVRQP